MGGTTTSGRISYTPLVTISTSEADNVDACRETGRYWIKENAQGCPIDGAPLFVVGAKDDVWQYAFDSQSGSMLRRHSADGGMAWNPWEWENPPVADGAEYRSTIRYGGKPVYTRRITIENAPDGTMVAVPHGLEGITPVAWDGVATDGESALVLPFLNSFTVGVDRTNITLSTTEDYSGYAVEITLQYCKEENE